MKKVNIGYFNYCSKLKYNFFKYQVSVKGQNVLSFEQIESFLDIVTSECDRFFPVFICIYAKNKTLSMLLKHLLIDTHGEA